MAATPKKNTLKITEEMHRRIRIAAALRNVKITDLVACAIDRELARKVK